MRLIHMGEHWNLTALLLEQEGVITTKQATELGLSTSEIRGYVRRGEWVRIVPGTYRLALLEETERTMVRAAALTLRAVLDRTTAAWWHGLLPELAEPLTMAVPHCRSTQLWTASEVEVKKRTFQAEDLTEVDGLAVVRKELSVLGSVNSLDDATAFVEGLLFKGEVTIESLNEALKRNNGLHGLTEARTLMALLDSKTQGKAEKLFRELLAEHEITGGVQQHRFQGWPLDFAWPELKVVVEVDGFAYHRSHQQFLNDMKKRNALTLNGWLVLNFSYHDLADDPIGCLDTLLAALNARLSLIG